MPDELTDLARRLGADWRPGDNVMTWIRRHEGAAEELSHLVRDGWSWADLGKALDLAGIRYRTGTVMSGDLLRRKAGKARADERKRQADQMRRRVEPAAPHAPLGAATPPERSVGRHLPPDPRPLTSCTDGNSAPEEHGRIAPEEPMFRLVTLRGGQRPPQLQPPPTSQQNAPSKIAKISDDEILRRVFGKP